MTIQLEIRYNTARSGNNCDAYKIDFRETDAAESDLAQQGATFNDMARYVGIYPDIQAAVRAALGFGPHSCKIVEVFTPLQSFYRYTNWGERVHVDEFSTVHVLGCR